MYRQGHFYYNRHSNLFYVVCHIDNLEKNSKCTTRDILIAFSILMLKLCETLSSKVKRYKFYEMCHIIYNVKSQYYIPYHKFWYTKMHSQENLKYCKHSTCDLYEISVKNEMTQIKFI